MESGVAFSGFALAVVVVSNVAQAVVTRVGVRPTLTAGLLMSALSVAWLTRLPVEGHYFWDLFPAFVLGGAGMGLSFVPVTIASLTGVERADAGVASGLVNTSRQIGGAVALAAVSAVAATSSGNFADAHGVAASSAAALDHGFRTGLYALTALLGLGALIAITLVRPAPPASEASAPSAEPERVALEEAA
jgi:MFS family permease